MRPFRNCKNQRIPFDIYYPFCWCLLDVPLSTRCCSVTPAAIKGVEISPDEEPSLSYSEKKEMFERLSKDAKIIPLPRDQQSFSDGSMSKRTSTSSSLNGSAMANGTDGLDDDQPGDRAGLPQFAERVEYFRRRSSNSSKSQDNEPDTATTSSLQVTPNTAKTLAIDTVVALQEQALDLWEARVDQVEPLESSQPLKCDSQSTITSGKSSVWFCLLKL